MGSRRSNNLNNKPENSKSKQQERETRQQEKKSRDKKTHSKEDEDVVASKNQLRTFNLELRNIIGDGNCLFRSFADQMDGDQHRYAYYREQICNFMQANREDFEPFIVDQPFNSFIRSLSKDGTYGGNECLVAFSRLFDARICIHQANQPVWTVCFFEPPKHEIHIFYHNHEHYSSVRKLGDHTATTANVRQAMTTCDPTTVNEKAKTKPKESSSGACAMEPEELFSEHDVEYIQSQLTSPVDPQLIRDTLTDNHGDIDGTITYLLTLDIPVTPQPTNPEKSDESIERIMAITQIYDVDAIQQLFATNNRDIDSTVEALLKLKTTDDNEYEEVEETTETTKTKNRPISNRQAKNDKKKAKKERATEKHRAQILAAANKPPSKQSEEKSDSTSAANNEQEQVPPANLEFIRI